MAALEFFFMSCKVVQNNHEFCHFVEEGMEEALCSKGYNIQQDAQKNYASTALLFCLDANHESTCLRIPFKPYLMVRMPKTHTKGHVNVWQNDLHWKTKFQHYKVIRAQSLGAGYKGTQYKYVQLFFKSKYARKSLIWEMTKEQKHKPFVACEETLSPEFQVCDTIHIPYYTWIQVSDATAPAEKRTYCDHELELHNFEMVSRAPTQHSFPPLHYVAFDIETWTPKVGAYRRVPKGTFEEDVVFCICSVLRNADETVGRVVHYLQNAPAPPQVEQGEELRLFQNQKELINDWRDMVVKFDTDILTGYNAKAYDLLFMSGKMTPKRDRFFDMSRIIGFACKVKEGQFQSRAFGSNVLVKVEMPGRAFVDFFEWIKRSKKLRSYKLDDVAELYLNKKKLKLGTTELDAYEWLFQSYELGCPKRCTKLVQYCFRDVDLVFDLMDHFHVMLELRNMAMITWTQIQDLVERGQSVKVMQTLAIEAHQHGFLCDPVHARPKPLKGGAVRSPKHGYYHDNSQCDEGVMTLDFQSLYPSIIRQHNLCFSTIVYTKVAQLHKEEQQRLFQLDELQARLCDCFVSPQIRLGLLPQILERLHHQRLAVKKEMKMYKRQMFLNAKNTVAHTQAEREFHNQNAKQLAIKVTMNSIYGFTGTTFGYNCPTIARTTTAIGRHMIAQTEKLVMQPRVLEANGVQIHSIPSPTFAEAEAQSQARSQMQSQAQPFVGVNVIYGDTDSVMVRVQTPHHSMDVAEMAAFGEQLAGAVTQHFEGCILLEYEKFYKRYFVGLKKKRYCGFCFKDPTQPGQVEVSGLDMVRRDVPLFIKQVCGQILDCELRHGDSDKARQLVLDMIQNFKDGTVPVHQLVMTSQIKAPEDYVDSSNIAHAHVAELMRQRGQHVPAGTRVPFLIRKGSEKKVTMRAIHPDMLRSPTQLDRHYYLGRMQRPITELMVGLQLFSKAELDTLFHGALKQIEAQQRGMQSISTYFLEDPQCKPKRSKRPKRRPPPLSKTLSKPVAKRQRYKQGSLAQFL